MRFIQIITVSVLASIFMISCSLNNPSEISPPSWVTTVEFPILSESVGLAEILKDSLITVAEGDSIFAFKDTINIDRVEVGNQLSMDDILISFTQSVDDVTIEDAEILEHVGFGEIGIDSISQTIQSQIGLIELSDIPDSGTDPFPLNEIYPNIELVEDGKDTIIPNFALNPMVNPFTFNDFSQAEFAAGQLNITIVNNMVITLGTPIIIQLQEIVGLDTIDIDGALVTFNNPILPSNNATESMSLAGRTLPGEILVSVSGNSSGSNGSTILIDAEAKASSFTTLISATGLQVSSATAVVPSQIINESGFITMAEDSNKVERAEIAEGQVQISIDNGLAVNASLTMTIQSLEDPTGIPFEQIIDLVANTPNNRSYSVDGYTLVMDINDQSVEYSYQIHTEDTSPGMTTLNESDSVVVEINLTGANSGDQITFSSFTGMITPQHQIISGEMSMDSNSEILTAKLSSGTLNIEINNTINTSSGGTPAVLIKLQELFDPNLDSLIIGPRTLDPGINSILVDLTNHTLKMPRNDQTLHYSATIETQYEEVGQYNLLDSISVDIVVSGLAFEEITGYFTQDAIVDSNAIVLNNATKVENAVINTGQMELRLVNQIGVIADIHFNINEFLNNGSSLDTVLTLLNHDQPQTHIIPLNNYTLQLPLNDQTINYISTISMPSDQEMTLRLTDSISVDVNIAGLTFKSIAGIIDPVVVELDTMEQTISAFPEQMSGIQFNRVDINIDFSPSTISAPVFLTLSITGENDEGETATSSISDWNITENPLVVIPNAADLININPTKIISVGSARVGNGQTVDTVSTDQFIEGKLLVYAPLELILEGDSEIDLDHSLIEGDLGNEIQRFVLFAEIDNQFDFGTIIEVLVAEDTLNFETGASTPPDTLFVLEISANEPQLDSIVLEQDQWDLLVDSAYIKPKVFLMGNQDVDGNILPSSFLSTDSISILLYGSAQILIELDSDEE